MHSGLKKAIILNFILGTAEQALSRRCEDEVLHICLKEVLSNGYFVYLYYQDEEKCSLSSDFHTDNAIIESLLYSATEMHTSLHFSPS